MAVSWTEEQKKVIYTRDRDILVSAAAGSGKTAVLVERIVQRITDPSDPVSVTSLLVVTFTRAAAAEMKVRPVPCRPPIAVFADPQVLRNAPEEMIAAGAGDIIGKYSSLIDWRLGALIRKEAYCAEMDEMTMKEVRQVTEDLSLIRERDADAIGRLMHSLVQIGVDYQFNLIRNGNVQ